MATPNGNHIPQHKFVLLPQFFGAELIVAEIAAKLIAKRNANIAALEDSQIYGNTTLVVTCTGNIGKTQEITNWTEKNVPKPWTIHKDENAQSGAGNQPYGQGIWKGASGRIADSASRFDTTLLNQHNIGTVLFVAIEDGIDEFPPNGPVTYAVGVCYNAKDKLATVANSDGVMLNPGLLELAQIKGFEDPTENERGIVTYGEVGEKLYDVPRHNWHPYFCGSIYDRYKYFHRNMMNLLVVPFVNKS